MQILQGHCHRVCGLLVLHCKRVALKSPLDKEESIPAEDDPLKK